ncbi:MAG TPA: exodeoxyribonuclease VII large subunit [Spirochaetales bacterium]|nr:exodeoxyribonuclease VII large subunit [Spirochaetales bacterium]HPS15191.1 exodeoxyribonuclease VII large subunit [Spirochaetales bacterium]
MGFQLGQDGTHESAAFLTVTELTSLIKGNLEANFPDVTVEGEISNAKLASSGHLYFSLKDENALIQAVMFKSRMTGLSFSPSDGLRVRARGAISVYAQRGQYQLVVQSLRKAGTGDILAMLEERKRILAAQGYFDQSRKKPLPRFPERVAIITSPTGAAVHDILTVLQRRNACIDVVIFPTPVQGLEAAPTIERRIEQANRYGDIDVIILCRGGGSLEDLLPFSEVSVVKAIAASRIPVISAIGHEIDWALSDYAADLRAPTPSAAAEMVAESSDSILREIQQFQITLVSAIKSKLDTLESELEVFSPELVRSRFDLLSLPLVTRVDEANETLVNVMNKTLTELGRRVELASGILETASPQAILRRGFSIVRHSIGLSENTQELSADQVVRSASQLGKGDLIDITFAKGSATANVKEIRK